MKINACTYYFERNDNQSFSTITQDIAQQSAIKNSSSLHNNSYINYFISYISHFILLRVNICI